MTDADDDEGVQTTWTSLAVVEHIRRENGARIADVARALDASESTVHRHLTTLEEAGYVQRHGEEYHLGLKLLDLGEFVRHQWPLDLINDTVTTLSDETDEEVDFLTDHDGRVITIESSYRKYHRLVRYGGDGDADRERAQLGNYYHMHVTGAGKAILAAYPDDRVERVVDRWGLPAKTENTITDREALFAELERIRERGYAVNDEEYANGLRSVATVVTRPDGGVFGALNVAGPTYRMDGVVLDQEIPAALAAASDDLESALADRPLEARRPSFGSY